MNLGGGGGGGTHDFFARGVSLYGLFFTLPGIFDEKVGPFSEFLCLLGSNPIQNTILRAVLEKNGSHFQTNF